MTETYRERFEAWNRNRHTLTDSDGYEYDFPPEEIFVPIWDYNRKNRGICDKYYVSDQGHILSFAQASPRVIKQVQKRKGSPYVGTSLNGNGIRTHVLVWFSFEYAFITGSYPEEPLNYGLNIQTEEDLIKFANNNGKQIHHRDSKATNNRLCNLRAMIVAKHRTTHLATQKKDEEFAKIVRILKRQIFEMPTLITKHIDQERYTDITELSTISFSKEAMDFLLLQHCCLELDYYHSVTKDQKNVYNICISQIDDTVLFQFTLENTRWTVCRIERPKDLMSIGSPDFIYKHGNLYNTD